MRCDASWIDALRIDPRCMLAGRDGEHLALSSFPTMDIELMFRSRGHVFVWSSTSLLRSDSK